MAKLKMTKTEAERAAEAAAATAGMTDEEKAAEVQALTEKVATDVDQAKPEAKPAKAKKDTRSKSAPSLGTVHRKTPGQEMMNPTRKESDPLQGVAVDPDANYPKILQLQVSIGDDDTRSMEEFIEDVKDALLSQANAKLATVLLSKVAIDGKHILNYHYENEVARLRPEETTDE